MFEWIQKLKGYDALQVKLQIALDDAERERNEKEHALDLCQRFQDDLKAAQRENASLAYSISTHNEASKKKIQHLKSKINKSKVGADKKILDEIKKLRHRCNRLERDNKKLTAEKESIRAELEKAQRLEWQYNTALGQWEPVHGSLDDIQNHVPWPMVQFKEVRLDK